MKRIQTKKEFIFELSNQKIPVSIEVLCVYDPSYGSDADGNRGVGAWLLDDVRTEMLSDVQLSDQDQKQLDALIETKIDETEWID